MWQAATASANSASLICRSRMLSAFADRSHQAVIFEVGQAGSKLSGALFRANLILIHQCPVESVEVARRFQQTPDFGGNGIEPETVAAFDVERDQLIVKIGFEQCLGTDVSHNLHDCCIALIDRQKNQPPLDCRVPRP